ARPVQPQKATKGWKKRRGREEQPKQPKAAKRKNSSKFMRAEGTGESPVPVFLSAGTCPVASIRRNLVLGVNRVTLTREWAFPAHRWLSPQARAFCCC